MPLRLDEIAREAGVSRSTVSRVLNQHPNVSKKARERVLSVTERLNFQPNLAARSLAAGRTRILGLVIPMRVPALFTDPYYPILIQGISAACNARDYSVMLWLAEPEYERRTMQKILQGGLIDGVIVSGMLVNDPIVDALRARTMPFVLVGRFASDGLLTFVDVDDLNSAREMVSYLLRSGYRRIATITGPQNMNVGIDRLAGYRAALRARGREPDSTLIVESDFTEEGGYHAMQRLLPHNPDAVFAASDAMAVGALRALREAGRRVPDDVALAGFDDMPFAARTEPPLTTVRQPIHRMGMVAAEVLIDLIEQPDSTPRRIILQTELVIRGSTGTGF